MKLLFFINYLSLSYNNENKILDIINPIPVPIMAPNIPISTPTGTKASLYAPAITGADATPPIFATDATQQVNRSNLKILANIVIIRPWIPKIHAPAII